MKKNRLASGASSQDPPDIQKIYGTWIAGYDAGDVTQVMSIFDRGLRYRSPCQPEQTFDTLSRWFEFDFSRETPRPTWSFEVESVDLGSDLSVVVGIWTSVTNFGGFTAHVRRLRSIDILRRGPDGWKIIRTINDPQPCDVPVRAPKGRQRVA